MVRSTRASLLSRVRDPADRDAWDAFVARYRGLIVAHARRCGLGAWDAEDVAQLVLLDLAGSLRRFRYDPARGRFRDYLRVVVRNRARRRPARREAALVEEAVPDERRSALDEGFEREWARHHLRLALGSLRRTFAPRSLEVFEALADGATTADAARRFGMSVAAVEKVRQRVRDGLRARLAEQLADEEELGA